MFLDEIAVPIGPTEFPLDNVNMSVEYISVQSGYVGSKFASCAICKKGLPPKDFDYRILSQLEADGEVYMAECLQCNDTLGGKERHQKKEILCNLCGVEKPRSEYRVERQRCNNYRMWRCRSCEVVACDKCGKAAEGLKKPGYRCDLCMWPPCACGRERPRSTKYSTKAGKAEWKCQECRLT